MFLESAVQLCDDALWVFEGWWRRYLDTLQLVASELDSFLPAAAPTHLGSADSPIVRGTGSHRGGAAGPRTGNRNGYRPADTLPVLFHTEALRRHLDAT